MYLTKHEIANGRSQFFLATVLLMVIYWLLIDYLLLLVAIQL